MILQLLVEYYQLCIIRKYFHNKGGSSVQAYCLMCNTCTDHERDLSPMANMWGQFSKFCDDVQEGHYAKVLVS